MSRRSDRATAKISNATGQNPLGNLPEENTLGIVIGSARRRVVGTARRLTGAGSPYRASLGTTFLGLGAAIIVGLRALYGLTVFIASWNDYPAPLIGAAAWAVLIAVIVAAIVTARVVGDRLPNWMFALFLIGIATSFVLDVVSVWGMNNIGRYATAAVVAGTALLVVVTLRGRAEILTAASVLGVALLGVMFFDYSLQDPATATDQITALAGAVLPAVIGVSLVESFRYMVQVELDRVLVQSTVSAPRFAVGMLASEELARLDLTAEELLDAIADNKVKLPLSPRSASVAAQLATELRLHLIEGRRETWLYHAISESELLGKAVSLVDKSSLAGLLDPAQRDGLLSTAWLLVSDAPKKNVQDRTITLQIGPVVPGAAPTNRKIAIPIVITTTGIARNRVDPSIWDALGRVGRYADSTQESSLRVDIECLVDNPADLAKVG